MQKYDAIIVGAGPAGGQCAYELSKAGKRVLLVDRNKNVLINNFSSGAAPASILSDFQLPNTIIGSFWHNLRVYSSRNCVSWKCDEKGPIFEFDKLRSYLIDQAVLKECEVKWYCQYLDKEIKENSVTVKLKELHSNSVLEASAKVLVDATGTDRKVINGKNTAFQFGLTGIEYHLLVSDEVFQKYDNSLNFFLGHKWMPQGYAWIFPKASNQIKIGIIKYFKDQKYVDIGNSYDYYMKNIIEYCCKSTEYEILDKHGKTIYYTSKQKDIRISGPIIAIGDAISAVNPLGCEGIRHAMVSGREAAKAIVNHLDENRPLSQFDYAMTKYFGAKWNQSEFLAKQIFRMDDRSIDETVKNFQILSEKDILDVVFEYKFYKAWKSFFAYLLYKAKKLFRT